MALETGRVLFVGGNSSETDAPHVDWVQVCRGVGQQIANAGLEIAVCSSFPSSADRYLFDGYVAAGGSADRLFIHAPSEPETIGEEWHNLLAESGLSKAEVRLVPGPNGAELTTRSNAYLLAQLDALEHCQTVIAIGGRMDGSAAITLRIAQASQKTVLPFSFARGAAAFSLRMLRQEIASRLGGKLPLLSDPTGWRYATDLIHELRNTSANVVPLVFISHAWARPHETDQVEMELQRYRINVFRDEPGLTPGADLKKEINDNLHECTHFLGLWCTEYACSPYCYDEYHSIHRRQLRDDSLRVLMLRLDSTRMVWPAMRPGASDPLWPEIRLDGNKESRAALRETLRRFVHGNSH